MNICVDVLIYFHIVEAQLIYVELFLSRTVLLLLILRELVFSWHSNSQVGLQMWRPATEKGL